MSAKTSHAEVFRLRQLKDSKLYRATQLLVMDRVEAKMREYYKSRNEKENDLPLFVPMLATARRKREQLKTNLEHELKMVDLQSCVKIETTGDTNHEE